MPIYSSHISGPRLPSFRRIGYHIKSTKTHSAPSLQQHMANHHSGDLRLAIPAAGGRRKFNPMAPGALAATASSTATSKTSSGCSIDIKIESPPLAFYGPPKESSGALLSGLIRIAHTAQAAQAGGPGAKQWTSLSLTLQAETLTRRPVHGGCAACATTTDVIGRWAFVPGPPASSYPFSFLLPGHLPASTNNTLVRIEYVLVATATGPAGDELYLRRPITVNRAILPTADRTSVRVFPPTNLSATATLPSVAHPGSDFAVDLRLDGVINRQRCTRWRMRKLHWRIDEASQSVSPACALHCHRLGGAGKGVAHEDLRTVGSGELRSGWKAQYDDDAADGDGRIEVALVAGIPAHLAAACDLTTSNGTAVEHTLVVEMIVAEEHCPSPGKPVTPTGAARVLRMQFRLVVTARSGLGISWDEEAPPVYADVPAPPPTYGPPAYGDDDSAR